MNKKIIHVTRRITFKPDVPNGPQAMLTEKAVAIASDEAQAIQMTGWKPVDNTEVDSPIAEIKVRSEEVGVSNKEPQLLALEEIYSQPLRPSQENES